VTASRITAAYDDVPIAVRFPRADAELGEPEFEVGAPLVAWLQAACDAAASIEIVTGDPPPMTWWGRDDGAVCGVGGGARIAAALLARACGGAFDPDEARGVSVLRATRELAAGVRDRLMPGGEWHAAPSGRATIFRVTVGGVDDVIAVAAVPAVTDPGPAREAWRASLGAALEAVALPVRLVLHEDRVALRTLRALSVGDIVPIVTAREVALRSGGHRLARGRIVDGEPRCIEIVMTGDHA